MPNSYILCAAIVVPLLSALGWQWHARRAAEKRLSALHAERASLIGERDLLAAMVDRAEMPIMAATVAQEYRHIAVNEAACRHFGVDRAELMRLTISDFDPSYTGQECRNKFSDLREGNVVHFSTEHLLATGVRTLVNVTLSRHRIGNDDVFISTVHDRSVETAARARIQELELSAELLHQERRYREILDALSDGVLLTDISSERCLITAVLNPAAAKMLGCEPDSAVNRPIEDLLPPKLAETILLKKRESVMSDAHVIFSGLVTLAEGAREIEVALIPLRNRLNVVHRIAVILRDVTEQRAHEADLLARAELERRLSEFIASAPGCFFSSAIVPGVNYQLSFCSEGSRDLYGIGPEQMCSGPNFHQIILEEDREHLFATVSNSARVLKACHVEYRILHPRKGVRWIEARSQPQRAPDGSVRFNGFMYDITERKEAEALRHKRNQEFCMLVEHSPDTIARYDYACRGTYANAMQLRAWNISEEGFVGKSPLEVPGGAAGDLLYARIEEALATGREDELEYRVSTGEGDDKWTHVRVVPEFDRGGTATHVLLIGRDISPLKAAERVLEESRARVRRMAAHRDTEQERERKRIAHGMHEDLAQILAVLGWELKRASIGLDPESPHALQMGNMSALAERALRTVRSTVNSLRPASLALGLVPALERLVQEFEESHGILCLLHADEAELALDDERATMLYRMTEAMLGIVLEAPGSEQVAVSVACQDSRIVLRVDDTNAHLGGSCQESLGLVIVQEFALRLKGEAVVMEQLHNGRVIEVVVPLLHEGQLEIAYGA